ncbi:cell wall-active antibiotics response protein LiaF [Paenibacillus methanolicus]|uniref:Lia operon protein LiaF n=1 Tax=Paenibacillus methanolicus TaxID=582686 RepID=A0A5S5BW60_9BACL|nr:cell wall-active antibiotics response protein LiaF [Paenibacillus methanolicus]TYP71267.1 lia operon protein LiaF [Paenibacillus methanolicus]
MNGHFANRLMWGLFIIGIGAFLMLRQTGLIEYDLGDLISVFWPVILLFLGIKEAVRRIASGYGSWWSSGILLAVGIVFLGRNLDLFDWSVGDLAQFAGPLVIILIGMRMMVKPKPKEKIEKPPGEEWSAYPSFHPDEPVPPAPPLHPDPTKASGEPSDFGKDSFPAPPVPPVAPSSPTSGQPGADGRDWKRRAHNERMQEEWNRKAEKLQRRAERMRERIEHRADKFKDRHACGRHDRMEWWNSDPNVQTRSGFIGDIYVGHDYWELKPMNISHFIGDTVLDLTKAQIPYGETRIHISSFIGDVKVFLPNDFETGVNVVTSAFVGDVAVLDRKEGGIFKNMNVETPYFQENEKKIKLIVSTFIGDVRVTKVG